jgi:hypothetical protein
MIRVGIGPSSFQEILPEAFSGKLDLYGRIRETQLAVKGLAYEAKSHAC